MAGFPLPLRRLQRPRAEADPAARRRGQRARARDRGASRRGDPRPLRRDPRRDRRDRRARRARPRTSSTTPTSSAAASWRRRAGSGRTTRIQAALDDVLPEVFAMGREAMRRTLGMRHFDVQLIGGDRPPPGQDRRDEDRRGQDPRPDRSPRSSTRLAGRGVHLVTVNDYLARRDPQWMGPVFHFLGLSVGIIAHDAVVRLRARLPDERRAAHQPAAGHPPRGLRRRHHLRHEQRVRLRLPPRQHGHRARPAGPARALLRRSSTRSTTSSSTRPGRRSSSAARPRSRPTSTTRSPASCPGSEPRPRATRRAATTSSTSRTGPSRRPRTASTRWRSSSASRTSTTPIRAWPATSSRPSGPTPSTSATATTSSRTARSSSSTSSPAARCRAGAGARASTRRSRRRRACGSSASP